MREMNSALREMNSALHEMNSELHEMNSELREMNLICEVLDSQTNRRTQNTVLQLLLYWSLFFILSNLMGPWYSGTQCGM